MNATTNSSRPAELVRASPAQELMEEVIKKHPFLEGMSPHQIRVLADCAMQTHFAANQLVLREGDPANRFYLIQKGRVALEAHLEGHNLVTIQILEAGDVLGWSWLFPPYFWHFNARALEPTEAVFFYGTALREESDADHELGHDLMKRTCEVLLQRLESTRRRLMETEGVPTEYRQSR
jgi:CRP/FNR family transcriptional regulator, cyclic AMP receptor protein